VDARRVVEDAPGERGSSDSTQIRRSLWIVLGFALAGFAIFCALAYSAWPDANGRTRHEAEVAFVAVVAVAVPILTALTVRSARSKRSGTTRRKSAGNTVVLAGVVAAPVLEHASWQLMAFAAFAGIFIVCAAVMIVSLMVTPDEQAADAECGGA
jgi:FtsH-binding integral membrane protein